MIEFRVQAWSTMKLSQWAGRIKWTIKLQVQAYHVDYTAALTKQLSGLQFQDVMKCQVDLFKIGADYNFGIS